MLNIFVNKVQQIYKEFRRKNATINDVVKMWEIAIKLLLIQVNQRLLLKIIERYC